MRSLYTILFYLALPFVLLRLLWRSRKNIAYRKRWAERFGYCPFTLAQCLWVHAASVGETVAAIPLIQALQKQYPELPIVVTNMTITGGVRVKAAFGDSVKQVYVPYDIPQALNRFLSRVNPRLVLVIETELWPNLFFACQKRQIPIIVANARLSEKSAKGYQRVKAVMQPMLNTIYKMAVQTQVEGERFLALGLPKEKMVVTGSIKFDVDLPPGFREKSEQLRAKLGATRPIWIAASTHATEEDIMIAAHKHILTRYPNCLLILVPRHPERFNAVFSLVQEAGLTVARRSLNEECTPQTQVYLGDTMGELLLMYSVSDVAFVAGSFASIGGHNMLEPAMLGKPVLNGPVYFNFLEISQRLMAANGMKLVNNVEELASEVCQLFADSTYRQTIGNNAQQFVEKNRGALAKHLKIIAEVLS